MAKLSKAKKLWREIDARIQFYEPEQLRQFFAAAAKFLIKSNHWDDSHPTTKFDKEAVIKSFHEGFEQFSRKEMLGRKRVKQGEKDFLELLQKASGWGGKDLRRRVAKRKLTKLRDRMKKRFHRFMRKEKQPLRGLRFYDKVMRTKYMTRKGKK